MKYLKEIKEVGLKNWLWFVVILRRDEFSPLLSAFTYRSYYSAEIQQIELIHARQMAHAIDNILTNIK